MLIFSLCVCTALAMLIHELGHLTVARACGVPASEFGLGLGPRIFGFNIRSVTFSFRALPLGSFVRLDGAKLRSLTIGRQLSVHLAGILFNLIAAALTYGTVFGWVNLVLAGANILPLYQHDGWKCGVAVMRALVQRESRPVELVFTFSGLLISWILIEQVSHPFIASIQFLSLN
jgi:membrane-associated protease RseP (regulator of RpoE activity)